MTELTYSEHVLGRRKTLVDDYCNETMVMLRNIILTKDDIENSILTDSFFLRDDVGIDKMSKLKYLTKTLKENLKDLTI